MSVEVVGEEGVGEEELAVLEWDWRVGSAAALKLSGS